MSTSKRIAFVAVLLALMVFVGVAFSGCDFLSSLFGGGGGSKLATPELVFNKAASAVEWAGVSDATGYIVTHNDGAAERLTPEVTRFELVSEGTHKVSVVAEAEAEKNNSDAGELTVTIIKRPVSGVSVVGGDIRADLPIRRYYTVASGNDLEIAIPASSIGRYADPSTADVALDIYVHGVSVLRSGDYTVDGAVVTLHSEFLAQFEAGAAVPVTLTVDGDTYDYVIRFTKETQIPELLHTGGGVADYIVALDKNDYVSDGITLSFSSAVNLLSAGVSVNAQLGAMSDGTEPLVAQSEDKRGLSLTPAFLTRLPVGRNMLALHCTFGDINVALDVYNSEAGFSYLGADYDVTGDRERVIAWGHDFRPTGGETVTYTVTAGGASYGSDTHKSRFTQSGTDWQFDLTGISAASATVSFAVDGATVTAETSSVSCEARPAALSAFIDSEFTYRGHVGNTLLSTEEEVLELLSYCFLNSEYLEKTTFALRTGTTPPTPSVEVVLAYALAPGGGFETDVKTLLGTLVTKAYAAYPEATKLEQYTSAGTLVKSDGGLTLGLKITLGFKMISVNDPSSTSNGTDIVKSDVYQAYRSAVGGRQVDPETTLDAGFPIAARDGVNVYSSDELVFVIESGFRPLFPTTGMGAADAARVRALYVDFLELNAEIIDDGMNDFEKVNAIYDWLVMNVAYDYTAAQDAAHVPSSSPAYDRFYPMRCFFLEGAITDKLAVCNGLSKAVVVMCGIEGIECYKLNGTTSGGEYHAWNKALIYGGWYLVDTTWGMSGDNADGEGRYNHSFLLYSKTEEAELDHRGVSAFREDEEGQLASEFFANDSGFNIYANRLFTLEGALGGAVEVHDFVIANTADASALMEYLSETALSGTSALVSASVTNAVLTAVGAGLGLDIEVTFELASSTHAGYREVYFVF